MGGERRFEGAILPELHASEGGVGPAGPVVLRRIMPAEMVGFFNFGQYFGLTVAFVIVNLDRFIE
jgi:hypothetical protein